MQTLRQLSLTCWTLTHGFYCVMGGFAIIPPEGSPKEFPFNTQHLCWLIGNGHVKPPTIAAKEIKDKSKMDSRLYRLYGLPPSLLQGTSRGSTPAPLKL